MNLFKSTALALVMVGAPLAASAATVTFTTSGVASGSNVTIGATSYGNRADLLFNFDDTTVSAYQDFTTNGNTTISLINYGPSGASSQSQYAIYYAAMGGPVAITGQSDCLNNFAGSASGSCNDITGINNNPTTVDQPIITFSNLQAGDYRIAFFNDTSPVKGQIDFFISAVPLPAGGLLLISALGGAAALRRRKAKNLA